MTSAPDLFSPDDGANSTRVPGPRAFRLKAKPENLRKYLRFTIQGVSAVLHVKGLLNTLGIVARNKALASRKRPSDPEIIFPG